MMKLLLAHVFMHVHRYSDSNGFFLSYFFVFYVFHFCYFFFFFPKVFDDDDVDDIKDVNSPVHNQSTPTHTSKPSPGESKVGLPLLSGSAKRHSAPALGSSGKGMVKVSESPSKTSGIPRKMPEKLAKEVGNRIGGPNSPKLTLKVRI